MKRSVLVSVSKHPSAPVRHIRRPLVIGLATLLITTGALVAPPGGPAAAQTVLPPAPGGSVGSWSHTYTEAGPSGRTWNWTIRSEVSTSQLDVGSPQDVTFAITTITEITTPIPLCAGNTGSDAYDTHPEPLVSTGWFVWPAGPQTPPWFNGDLLLPASSQVTDGDVFTSSSPCTTYFRETTTQDGILRGLGSLDSNPATAAIDPGCYTPVSWNASLSGAPAGYTGGSFATVTVGDADCRPAEFADLSVTMTGPVEVRKDALMQYEITVTNNGPFDATDVFADLTMDPFVTFITPLSGETCSVSETAPVCRVASMDGGEQVVLIVQARSGITSPRLLTSSVQVRSATFDPDASNNSASATTQLLDQLCKRARVQTAASFNDANTPPADVQDYPILDTAFNWCSGAGQLATIDPASISVVASTNVTSGETLLAQAGIHFRATDQARATSITPSSFTAQGTFEACIDTVSMLTLLGGPGTKALLKTWSKLPLKLRIATLQELQKVLAATPTARFLPGFSPEFRELMVRNLRAWLNLGFTSILKDGFGVFCFDFWKPDVQIGVSGAGVQATSVGSAPVASTVRVRVNDLPQ